MGLITNGLLCLVFYTADLLKEGQLFYKQDGVAPLVTKPMLPFLLFKIHAFGNPPIWLVITP